MKRTWVVLGLVGWSLLGFAASIRAEDEKKEATGAEVGKPAPDFTLKDIEGKEHKLSDYKGKVVVLEWTSHHCPFVVRHQKEQQTMQKTYAEFKDQGVVWLAIDSTRSDFQGGYTNEKISGWVKDAEVTYPILRDEDGAVGKLYGAKTTPHMFVIDKEGKIVYAGAIDDDVPGRKDNDKNYVAEALKATLAGSTVETPYTKPYGCSIKYAD